MFEGFKSRTDKQAQQRVAISTGASLALYGLMAFGVVALAGKAATIDEDKVIEVAFHKPPAPEPEPEPPPPAPEPEPESAPKPAIKPKPVASDQEGLAVPTELPDVELNEGDERDFQPADFQIDTQIGGSAGVSGVAVVDTPPPPPPPPPQAKPKRREPIIMPENATPPIPHAGNVQPVYPDTARKQGVEGVVILKVIISETGAVEDIEVMKGQEPFIAAALAAVRAWRYKPAVIEGEPTSVYRIIRVPFKLKR